MWVAGILRGGLLVIRLYLWHTEGLIQRIEAASEWLRQIGGCVRAPSTPTCKGVGGGRVIDFIVADARVSGAIAEVFSDLAFPQSPHSLVVVRFRCVASVDRAMLLVQPSALPLGRPHGCPRLPAEALDAGIIRRAGPMKVSGKDPVDEAFAEVMGKVEDEWCNMVGLIDDPSGQPLKKAAGRGSGPKFRCGQVVSHRAVQDMGRTDDIGLGLSSVSIY